MVAPLVPVRVEDGVCGEQRCRRQGDGGMGGVRSGAHGAPEGPTEGETAPPPGGASSRAPSEWDEARDEPSLVGVLQGLWG